MSQDFDLSKKRTLIFITGASRGFGRACAISSATKVDNSSVLVICGRNLEYLAETKDMVLQINENITVELFHFELENVNFDEIKMGFEKIINCYEILFDCFIIIHNAGTIGDVKKLSYENYNKDELDTFMKINASSAIIVNNVLTDYIRRTSKDGTILVVNVSSLCAIEPTVSCSLYCAIKSFREMFFRCLAAEWSKNERLKLFVINYAPGPMDTDMLKTLCNCSDSNLSSQIKNIIATGEALQPIMSSEKLFCKILAHFPDFVSGSRIDYYDI